MNVVYIKYEEEKKCVELKILSIYISRVNVRSIQYI